jgi:hypothetical protein
MKGEDKVRLWKTVCGILAVLLLLSILTNGFTNCQAQEDAYTGSTELPSVGQLTFDVEEDEEVCTEEGMPVIRLFSTTSCPHCGWVKETFDKVAREYVLTGKIKAYHWELDLQDDTLTLLREGTVPEKEVEIFTRFNPKGYVPLFVFGCKYTRMGNAYELEGDAGLLKEEAEFRKIIEELIK